MVTGLLASPAMGAPPLYTASYACPDKSDPGQRMNGVDINLTMQQVAAIRNFLKQEFCTDRQLEFFIVTRQ
jgi:hypothetical protein